ncbi:hypothetical protein F4860DRAFT_496555 [Xylaria cubensis]|nr:hypothetical protein F4860DRAFT_496555 [Xylaria cubensis]
MKFSQLFLAIAAISITYADFWMVYQHRYAQIGLTEDTSYGASFISDMSEWTCEADTFTHRIHPDRRNISGQNYGVQFEPWNPQPGPFWHDPLGSVNMNLDQSPIGEQSKQTHTASNQRLFIHRSVQRFRVIITDYRVFSYLHP